MLASSRSLPPSYSITNQQQHGNEPTEESPFRYDSPFEGPFREELIAEIYKGRDLLVYYEYILLGTFLLIVVAHWTNKLLWYIRNKQRNPGLPIYNRNENSTEESLISEDTGASSSETDPLLGNRQHSMFKRIYYRTMAFFMFQPEGKGMENYGVTMMLIVYELMTIFFALYQIRFWIILAFRLGLLATINIPLMYVLGAKHSPLSYLTGWSYEQVNVFHRLCGAICFFLVIPHLIIFACYFRFDYLLTHLWSVAGIIAGIAFIAIGFSSSLKFRESFYELFYVVHIVGFLVSIPAVYLHYPTARPYAVAAGLSVLYDRLTRLLLDYRIMKCIIRPASGETVIMDIPFSPGPKDGTGGFFGRPFAWTTGQHIYITVIGCGTFESHPYTIASTMKCSKYLRLIIRARDGFSRRLLELAESKHGLDENEPVQQWCILHGPYGVHPPEMPSSASPPRNNTKLILVAGGAGVAFTYPLYQEYHLANKLLESQTKLVGQSSPSKFDINFLWVLPHSSFSEWLVEHGETVVDTTKMDIWATREKGRPDINQLILGYISKANGVSSSEDHCWVAACGPDPLLREVRNAVANLRGQGMSNVHYYAERFGW
ncbi:Fre1p [Sugiyamaella lignohabitans]|uniref:ferric-chelate reductase (NADPH) n=1 Tax=Sugiyamaella lignohabitans TaxID=796027 RepID=A0A167EX78_9ASCO|nr:Fre1p [Sugiyamaella lignohabitans]ANB14564.1 Fre1p [Sugiyamaella lignohabitans]